jgi:hypothetical protein
MLGLLLAASCLAACPPAPEDGQLLRQDGVELAWRPVLKGKVSDPSRIPMAEHFGLEVQVCAGTAATATLLRVDATMPEHRHGMNYTPRITPLGGGRWRVEGMMFHMSGRWQMEFELRDGSGTQRLRHDIQVH